MIKRMRGQSGQGISTEYVVIFFVAITAIAMMSKYVQRAYQGRVFDMQKYTMKKAAQALKKPIPYEYEPYYAKVETNTATRISDSESSYGDGVFNKVFDQQRRITSVSEQKPPVYADVSAIAE